MIISIIGWASIAHMLVDLIEHLDVGDKLPSKPLKCDMCIAFWISLPYNIYTFGGEGLLVSAITGITANLIYKLNQRL